MNRCPDVSVVMSVYNGADRLHETMESVLTQEGVSLEFIIVNDGSTDGSAISLDNYADRDPRVRILHQENQGLARALIKGCASSRGRYIARQDAGDLSLPGRLLLQKELLDEHDDCVFVSCWTSWIGPRGEYLFTDKGQLSCSQPRDIIALTEAWGVISGPTSHPSVMFRRSVYEAVGGYRPAFGYAEDWDLWYRLAERGKFAIIEQPLVNVRIVPGSISSSNRRRNLEYARLARKTLDFRL